MSELMDMGGSEEEVKEYWGTFKRRIITPTVSGGKAIDCGPSLKPGSLKLKPEALDLRPILDESQNTVYPLAMTKTIIIKTEVSESLPMVMGDHNALEQVFTTS